MMKRLLIVGCGDVAVRMIPALAGRYRMYALTRSEPGHPVLREYGVTPILGDLDAGATLGRLSGLAHDVVHLAPPPASGTRDTRTVNLIRSLSREGRLPQRLVYISTSGVYGDCGGDWVAETRPLRPQSDRARRRADAERQLRAWGRGNGVQIVVLRVPGIYAADRLPLERLAARTPTLAAADDAFTNHIHADDLARVVIAALSRGRTGRTYNANDDSGMKMGDYFDLVATRFGLDTPPRISWHDAQGRVPESLLSFMRESRRLLNHRLKLELRVRLRYPTVAQGLPAAATTSTGRVAK